jgi:hypothetical protein
MPALDLRIGCGKQELSRCRSNRGGVVPRPEDDCRGAFPELRQQSVDELEFAEVSNTHHQ